MAFQSHGARGGQFKVRWHHRKEVPHQRTMTMPMDLAVPTMDIQIDSRGTTSLPASVFLTWGVLAPESAGSSRCMSHAIASENCCRAFAIS